MVADLYLDRIGTVLSRSRGGSDGEAAVSAESLKLLSYGIMLQTGSWRLVTFSFCFLATCWTPGLSASAQVSLSVLAVWGRPGRSQHVSHAYASRRLSAPQYYQQ